ncbi:MAG: signal peptidase II [Candidatus Sericytochromatia bacterium]
MRQRLLIVILICLPCVLSDQLSKAWATAQLMNQPGQSFWGGILRLEYALNPGAWGSLGAQLPDPLRKAVFTLGVGAMLVALLVYTLRQPHNKTVTAALGFVLAGGIGNLIDRALNGHVVDFLYLGVPGSSWLHTNIFNLADVYIMLGAGLMLLQVFQKPDASESVATEPAPSDHG